MSDSHSFSTRDKDTDFIQQLKVSCIKRGLKFSWVVVKALREYEAREQAKQKASTNATNS